VAADLTTTAPPVCAARAACGGCGSGDLRPVLDLGSSPLADRFPLPGDVVEPSFPLRMLVCGSCWLAQIGDVVDSGALFGDGYGFATGGSPAAVTYFGEWAARVLADHPGDGLVVEIGCSDGTLLAHFADAGRPVLGVEPASPAGELAMRRGLFVLREPFTSSMGWAIAGDYGPVSLVIACNVVAHTEDPAGFLAGVAAMLAPDGAAVIEFQDLAALVAGCQFDHVYHEHRFFFSLPSFRALAWQAGLAVTAVQRTPAQGGSLRVTLRRGMWARLAPADHWLCGPDAYTGLQARAEYTRTRLLDLLGDEPGTVAGYAASAKSATLLNFCGIGPGMVPWVTDATPYKAGRLTPGTRIPIVAPGACRDPAAYLLLAWNYLGAVLRRERAFTAAGGRFIVPIPVPVVL
jgi:methylation protein EvaC